MVAQTISLRMFEFISYNGFPKYTFFVEKFSKEIN